MGFNGEWYPCADGIIRPIIRGEMLANNGAPQSIPFLVDTGADGTVISANALELLDLPRRASVDRIGGIGGLADSVTIAAELRLLRDDGKWATFRGEYAACTQYEILDMSVLGRDIMNCSPVIVDRRAGVGTLVGEAHTYTIQKR